MNLQARYEALFNQSLPKIRDATHEIDSFIDAPVDNRFGLSLILRPSTMVQYEVEHFLSGVKNVEPDQYYYAPSQFHITVLSIISCSERFRLDTIKVSDYIRVVEKSLKGMERFEMNYQGITASKAGLMLQGYPEENILDALRNQLRLTIGASDLRESMDQRYKLTTAHATIMRFRNHLNDAESFIKILKENRKREFGTEMVSKLYLVSNDWYHKPNKTRVLKTFSL